MRQWIGIVSTLLEKHAHHRKHHTNGARYGFFPMRGIYVCGQCGSHAPIAQASDHCPACGGSSTSAPVNTGTAVPAGGGIASPSS